MRTNTRTPLILLFVFALSILVGAAHVRVGNGERSLAPQFTINSKMRSVALGNAPSQLTQEKVLCLLVEFSDVPHSKSSDYIRSVLDEMAQYWTEVSYGQLNLSFALTDWLRLTHTMSYYGEDFLGINDVSIEDLVKDAVRLADSIVDFRLYDFVMIVHAGRGQEISSLYAELTGRDKPERIWSCALKNLSIVTDDGITIQKACIVPEEEKQEDLVLYDIVISEGKSYGLLGVYAHEFGHLLGLPDLYDTSSMWGEDTRVGVWDLMSSGAKLGDLTRPSQLSVWCKTRLGWISPKNVTPQANPEIIELIPIEQNREGSSITIELGKNISYFAEYRLKVGFDDQLPQEGLLITRVNETDQKRPEITSIDSETLTSTKDDAAFQLLGQFRSQDINILVLEANRSSCVIAVSSLPFVDSDSDGLPNMMEQRVGTNMSNSDTDGDSFSDYEELVMYGTNPLKADTDGDGVSDSKELQQGTSPIFADSDVDLWSDGIDLFPLDSRFPNWILIGVAVFSSSIPASLVARRLFGEKSETLKEAIKYRGAGIFLMMIGGLGGFGALALMAEMGVHIFPPVSYYVWGILVILILLPLGVGYTLARKGKEALSDRLFRGVRRRPSIDLETKLEKYRLPTRNLDEDTADELESLFRKMRTNDIETRSLTYLNSTGKMNDEEYERRTKELTQEKADLQTRINIAVQHARSETSPSFRCPVDGHTCPSGEYALPEERKRCPLYKCPLVT